MKSKILKMMKVVIIVGLSIVMIGCSSQTINPPTRTPISSPTSEYLNEPPSNVTWISPGKVEVGNFYPGATAEWPIRVHNGNDEETEFTIKYRYPDHVGDGFVFPTDEVEDWITIETDSLTFNPHETKDILVVLHMPSNADTPGDKWEFWISIIDASQSGFVKTELCVRWLITME